MRPNKIAAAMMRPATGVAQVVDTAELFCFKRHRKLSLRFLAAFLLRIDIQGQVSCPIPAPLERLSPLCLCAPHAETRRIAAMPVCQACPYCNALAQAYFDSLAPPPPPPHAHAQCQGFYCEAALQLGL